MRTSISSVVMLIAAMCFCADRNVFAFQHPPAIRGPTSCLPMSTMAESGVPPPTSDATDTEDIEIPRNLPSACGMDYVPLATMLATGQLAEADQVRFGPTVGTLTSQLPNLFLVHEVHTRCLDRHFWSEREGP